MKLKGSAKTLWYIIKKVIFGRPIISWIIMLEKLKDKYLSTYYMDTMPWELVACNQSELSVDEYTNNFHEISFFYHVNEADYKTIICYREGLCNDMQQKVAMHDFYTIDEVH